MASGAKTTQSRIARSTRSSQPHRRRHRVLRFSPGVFFGCFLPALPSGEMGIFCSKSQDHHTDLDALGTIQEINPGENAFAGCARIRGHEFLKENYSVLGWRLLSDEPHPLVYAQDYNITFFGLEKIHPFDSCKYKHVLDELVRRGVVNKAEVIRPAGELERERLLDVHSTSYLDSLKRSSKVAEVVEMPLHVFPNSVLQSRILRPMRTMAKGTVLAAGVAATKGACINLGGGMHHASRDAGQGWCAYDDWYLALRYLRDRSGGRIRKALYVDLDVHQGNGVARDRQYLKDNDMFILDMYNSTAFPLDYEARKAIDVGVKLKPGTKDDEYLEALRGALEDTRARFDPDIVLYNAGTDVLDGDPLGHLAVSTEGIAKRDEMVFQFALDIGAPIVMCTSGGYAPANWKVISRSLLNLQAKFGILNPVRETSAAPVGPAVEASD